MSIEFIGLLHPHDRSEIHHSEGPVLDPPYARRLLRAHEDAGFDRVLVGSSSSGPESLPLTMWAATVTERLGFMVAHRPGATAPTVAARAFATIDQLSGGRVALHTITGRDDREQRRDGDRLGKEERYARTAEYLQVLKRAWTATEPFSFAGTYYEFEDFATDVRPLQQPHPPIYFAGSSDAAYAVGAAEADVYALYAQPLAQIAEEIAGIRAAAAAAGRTDGGPRFLLLARPILGPTEDLAWERAHRILDLTRERRSRGLSPMRGTRTALGGAQSAGDVRATAVAGERHDRALWTAIAATTQRGNASAFVGTPETVAAALLDYVDLGISTFLLHGFNPYDDAIDIGRQLIPLVQAGAA